jgi:LacI family transcriptional regulator, fructose operon transcriptional repressor
MPNGKKTTIYDIAKEARSSASTVASVLNGTWKKRRIKESTAKAIQKIAVKRAYSPNLQARGLRKSRSGLVGMIIPFLEYRFFSSLAEAFEKAARAEQLYPVVVSTLRDPANEQATVRALISHNVEALFLAGATDPDTLSEICRKARVKHVNVDLPGSQAPSVISDNFHGAVRLTGQIVNRMRLLDRTSGRQSIYFIGGAPDYNTQQRIEGFRSCLVELGIAVDPLFLQPCGYESHLAEAAIRQVYAQSGRLPHGLFVNSTTAFEGIARFLQTLPLDEVRACAIGCFDWDPYIEFLNFPVIMVRQNVHGMIAEAYRVLKGPKVRGAPVVLVPTELITTDNQFREGRTGTDDAEGVDASKSRQEGDVLQDDDVVHVEEQRAGSIGVAGPGSPRRSA